MNKRIIAALIAASGLVAFNASANDGTVNFIGDITDGACTVDVQNTGSSTGQVTLGSVLMNPLMILVKIIKLRWIHILSYDQ
ncbi:hypothetical protein POX07_15660, partial [Klebsiella pneumoniae]